MRFGSVCSGIEAASVASRPLGWQAAWLSEIEPFPSAVLAHHYPAVPNLGDMCAIPAMIRAGQIEAPDVFVGGTPCQAFSVAGNRESLGDDRGQLSMTFCEITDAVDDVRRNRGEPAAIVFWENVPGVLSTKDNAFGCFLGALAGEDCALQPAGGKWTNAGCVFGPQRAIAWRVLDAQYFGLAQRRKRVFVVASARDGFDPAQVLFEFDGVRRGTAPSREAGQEIAGAARGGTKSHWDHPAAPRPILSQSHNTGAIGASNQEIFSQRGAGLVEVSANRLVAFGEYTEDGTASTMKARDYKDATDLVAYGIPGNWIGRAPENGGNAVEPMHDVAPCLTSTDRHAVSVHGTQDPCAQSECAFALGRNSGQENAVLSSVIPSAVRRLMPVECERLQGFPDSYTNIPWAICQKAIKAAERALPKDATFAERVQARIAAIYSVAPAAACGAECPDGPRYKALGNSWAVNCVQWIFERIDRHVRGEL